MSIRRAFVGVAAFAVGLSACSGAAVAPAASSPVPASVATASGNVTASAAALATPTPRPTATPPPTATPVPTPAAFTMNSTAWFGGYAITVTGGDYDPVKRNLNIDASFQNTSTQQTDLGQLSNAIKIVWNGQFLPGYLTPGPVPAGATARARIQLQGPVGFSVADAVLTFGQPVEHQALVPLNGTPATSDQPVVLAVAGKVSMGKYVTFTVSKGIVIPASCNGYADKMKFGSLSKNQVSIVLWGTATNTEPTNYASIDQGFVTVPDGTTSLSNPSVSLSLAGKATLRDQGMCFAVPAPAAGSYTLTLHEYRSKASGKLAFIVP
jgi:hypothetical protein